MWCFIMHNFYKKLLTLGILLFLGGPLIAKAADFNISYAAYTCPLITDAASATEENLELCAEKYVNGELDAHYINPSKDKLQKDSYVIIVQILTQNNSSIIPSGINLATVYDSNVFEPIDTRRSAVATAFVNRLNPLYGSDYREWTDGININKTSGIFAVTVNTDFGDVPLKSNSGPIFFMLYKVKSDTTSSDVNIQLDKGSRTSITAEDTSIDISFDSTDLSLQVASSSANTDTSLKTLTVTGSNGLDYSSKIGFTAGTSERIFNLILPSDITSITISAETTYELAKLVGLSEGAAVGSASKSFTLNLNENNEQTIKFDVIPESSPTPSPYTINVKRLSNDTSFKKFDIYEYGDDNVRGNLLSSNIPTSNPSSTAVKYTNSVRYAVGALYIDAELTNGNATIVRGIDKWSLSNFVQTSPANNGVNQREIVVRAENCSYTSADVPGNTCTEETYNLEVTREEPSHDNYITALSIDGNSIFDATDREKVIYNYEPVTSAVSGAKGVRNNVSSVTISATLSNSLSEFSEGVITGSNQTGTGTCNLELGPNACKFTVKSEDGEERVFTINIYRFLNNNALSKVEYKAYRGEIQDNSLVALTVDGERNYKLVYGPRTTKLDIIGIVEAKIENTVKASIRMSAELEDGTIQNVGTVNNGVITYSPTFTTGADANNVVKITISVTSEDGENKDYPITLERGKSTDTTLKSLSVTGNNGTNYDLKLSADGASTSFNPEHHTYFVTVDPEVTSLTVNAEKNDFAKSVTINNNENLGFGNNQVTIQVVAEEESNKATYTLNVERLKYDKAELASLSVKNGEEELITNFNKDNGSYTVNVPYETTSIDLGYTFNSDYHMTITGAEIGTKNLNTGVNTYEITVTSQATDATRKKTKKYTVIVNRSKNQDPSIKNITIHQNYSADLNATCDNTTRICTIDAGAKVNSKFSLANNSSILVNFDATPSASDAARATAEVTETYIYATDDDYNELRNEVPIVVQPEDETVSPVTYTLVIYKEKSQVATLDSFSLYETINGVEETSAKECTFASGVVNCTIDVNVDTTSIRVTARTTDTKARVTFASADGSETGDVFTMDASESEKDIIATVTSEYGTTSTYTIRVNRDKSSDNLLSELLSDANSDTLVAIPNFSASTAGGSYTLSVPGNDHNISIKAVANDPKSTITVTGATDTNADQHILEISKDLQYGISVDSANPANEVIITVTSESGVGANYTINIIRRHNEVSTLKDLQVGTEASNMSTITGFDTTGATNIYNLPGVSYETTSLNILASMTDELANINSVTVNGSAVSITESNELSFVANLKTGSNRIIIRTMSHDKEHPYQYTINVTRGYNEDVTIESIDINVGNGETKKAYCDLTTRKCYADKDSQTSVVVPWDYKVADSRTIQVNLKAPAVETDKWGTAEITSTNLLTTDSSNNQVKNEVPILVNAEKPGISGRYTLYIERTKNADVSLNKVNIYASNTTDTSSVTTPSNLCTMGSDKNCNLTVDVSTKSFRLEGILGEKASVVFSATINGTSVTGPEFLMDDDNSNITVTATVTAENGDTETYTINVSRSMSNNSFLSKISTNAKQENLDNLVEFTDFVNTTQDYTIDVEATQATFTFEAVASDPKAMLKVNVDSNLNVISNKAKIKHTVNLNESGKTTKIEIVVTPEDSSGDRIYKLNIRRLSATDARLSNILINGQNITKFIGDGTGTFNPESSTYTLNIQEYATNKLNITATTVDTRGRVQVNGDVLAADATKDVLLYTVKYDNNTDYTNEITVTGIAQDGKTTKDYTVLVKRKANSSTKISKVEVYYDNAWHDATCEENNPRCNITVPNNVTSVKKYVSGNIVDGDIRVTPVSGINDFDASASVTMTSMNLVTDNATTGNVNKHGFTVTAEDGTTTEDYEFNITRELSDDATLESIQIYSENGSEVIGNLISKENNTYTFRIPVNAEKFKIVATPKDSHTEIINATTNPLDSTSLGIHTYNSPKTEVIVTSTPESKKESGIINYTVNVIREANTNTEMKSIKVVGSDNKEYTVTEPETGSNKYTVTVPGELEFIKLNAEPLKNTSKIEFTDADTANPDGVDTTFDAIYNVTSKSIKTITMTVLSEEALGSDHGAKENYTLEVTVLPKTGKTLESLKYCFGSDCTDLNELITEGSTVTEFDLGTVENDVKLITINATPKYGENSTIKSGSNVGKNMSITTSDDGNTYTITVEAEDGSTKDYKIKVKRKKSSDTTVKSITIKGSSVDITSGNNFEFNLTDSKVTELLDSDIIITPNDSNAKVINRSGKLEMTKGGDYHYTFEVQAENGDTDGYDITIHKAKSNNDYLSKVELTGATLTPTEITHSQDKYTLNVAKSISEIKIKATSEDSNATISYLVCTDEGTCEKLVEGDGNGTYTNIYDGEVIKVSVEAEDKHPARVYEFTVVVTKSTEVNLNDLSVTGYTFKNGVFDPNGSRETFIIESVEKDVKTLEVYAESQSPSAKIYLYNENTTNANLISECNSENGKVRCNVPIRTEAGSGDIKVKVVAEAGEIYNRVYTINYTKLESKDNYLSSIESYKTDTYDTPSQENIGKWNMTFNKGTTTGYIIELDNDVESIDLLFKASDLTSSIQVGDITRAGKLLYNVSINAGESKKISAKVTSEDGNSKTYELEIKRDTSIGSTVATLSSINVSLDGTDLPLVEVAGKENTYRIDKKIPYSVQELLITATKDDGSSRINYLVDGVLQTSDVEGKVKVTNQNGKITLLVTPEAGSAYNKTYVIEYEKEEADANANLSALNVLNSKLSEVTLTPNFNGSTGPYKGEVEEDIDSILVTATTESTKSSIKINGSDCESGVPCTISGLEKGNNVINVVVTAENGLTKTYELDITRKSTDEIITSYRFGHDISDGYIKTVSDQKKISQFKTEFDNDYQKLVVKDKNNANVVGEDEIVGTGMWLYLMENDRVLDYKRVIIKGDVNGDGEIDIFDISIIINQIVGIKEISSPYSISADVDKNNEIDIFDISEMINHIVGIRKIQFK